MPAHRLVAELIPLERFDVVGQDSGSVRDFVRHLGLSLEARDGISCGETVAVRHMGPPIENPGKMCADSIGTAALTVDEANQIKIYLDEVEAEYDAALLRPNRFQQYVIVPHIKPWLAKDGTILWLRFSCVGFVIESYREADIDLVNDSEGCLWPVYLKTLDQAYPDFHLTQKDQPKLREYLGIPGKGPWRVMLAGYVLHALNRTKDDIRRGPYSPHENDAIFP